MLYLGLGPDEEYDDDLEDPGSVGVPRHQGVPRYGAQAPIEPPDVQVTPVIVNLQNVERDLSRRLIDFASGLCYGLGGTMEKVANQVYLLTPSNVEISAEERRRLQERGLYD